MVPGIPNDQDPYKGELCGQLCGAAFLASIKLPSGFYDIVTIFDYLFELNQEVKIYNTSNNGGRDRHHLNRLRNIERLKIDY